MPMLALLIVAFALSLDAAAEAIARGQGGHRPTWGQAAGMGLVFGAFQVLLPCLGWWLAVSAHGLGGGHERWVVCILLAAIGGRMLWEATSAAAAPVGWPGPLRLLGLGLVTSLDGFAIGVGLATLAIPPLAPALLIGAITLVVAILAARHARAIGRGGARLIGIAGGLLLIAIGGGVLLIRGTP